LSATRTNLAREANEKAAEIRDEKGYDPRTPLCIYELCDRLGLKVRFVDDVSMEGFYRASGSPTILLSSLRPLSRRAFTAAHELGHHVFGHKSTIDELKEEAESGVFIPEEFLVDCFAGYLLMPPLGIKRALASRGLDAATASPEDVYRVACSFGVGYTTLADHLAYALKLIPAARAETLRKIKLPQIRERLTGISLKEHLIIADQWHAAPTIDAEVGNLVLLPTGARSDTDQIEPVSDVASGSLFRALRPGLARTTVPGTDWAVIVRVCRAQYAGLAKYRHLEETDGE
jgi:Zn-dependent peptidase ImmA (M78 family)